MVYKVFVALEKTLLKLPIIDKIDYRHSMLSENRHRIVLFLHYIKKFIIFD